MLRIFATPFAFAIAAAITSSALHAQAGSYVFTGQSCGPATLQARGVPTIGQTFSVELPPDSRPVDGPGSFLLMGFRALPTPIDIGVITGGQPCGPVAAFCGTLFSSVDFSQVMPFINSASGLVRFDLRIPNDPTLVRAVFFQQNLTIGSGFGPRCVDLSRTGIGTIGR